MEIKLINLKNQGKLKGKLKEINASKTYAVVIIGTGSAGYSAAIYSARYGLSVLLIGESHGGTIINSDFVSNYPGFKKIAGHELMDKFKEHVEDYNVPILEEKVITCRKQDSKFIIETDSKTKITSRTLIAATGGTRKKLNIKGEDKYLNKGVSYCAVCDGPLFKNKTIGIVGGGNGAASAALVLKEYASFLYLIVREEKMQIEKYWQDKLNELIKQNKLKLIYNTEIKEIFGNDKLKGVKLNQKYNNKTELELQGLFIEIGSLPNSEIFKELNVNLDTEGHIIVDPRMKTNIPGFYAAGDVNNLYPDFRQVLISASQGALAADYAQKYLNKNNSNRNKI